MNRRFQLDVGWFLSNLSRKIKLSNSYLTQKLNILTKAVGECMEVLEKEKSVDYRYYNNLEYWMKHMRLKNMNHEVV